MGVDYYACQNCGETFPDCGSYFSCDCERMFCTEECGGKKVECEGFINARGYREGDSKSCAFCRGEQITDRDLLSFCLRRLGMTHDQATSAALESARAKESK